MSDARARWQEANQSYLMAAIALVERQVHDVTEDTASSRPAARERLENAREAMPSPPALDLLCEAFGLSPFERDTLLLCAAVELDSAFAARLRASEGPGEPTFGMALATLGDPHWSALAPVGPLRRWRLVEKRDGGGLTSSPLGIDERILHFLTGVAHLDERLAGIIEPLPPSPDFVPSHERLAEEIGRALERTAANGQLPAVELLGSDPGGKRAVAQLVAQGFGLDLHLLPAPEIPPGGAELDGLTRLWEREATLTRCALYIDAHGTEAVDGPRGPAVSRLVDGLGSLVFVANGERRRPRYRPVLAFDVGRPSMVERRAVWARLFGEQGEGLDGRLEAVAANFRLGTDGLRAAGLEVRAPKSDPSEGEAASEDRESLERRLWEACRRQARPRLEGLAQRIEPLATWKDLVLPERQIGILRQVAVNVRQRHRVYESWAFAARCSRGLGVSALFAGVSGTGKTMAAEVLANELRLDLYRIDLSSVVSKYIGETEKNLRRVFDAAEEGGAILLFDEADALFGKRSEVKDSHDRYANIEISYLLQRMESYRGLAILTTNMKSALDRAFLRRLRFVVEFPFPDPSARAEIWQRIFPPETPTADLDVARLARLSVAGGNILNIALGAAFTAAEEARAVDMGHLLAAARREYRKLERPLTEAEIRGWVG